MMVSRKNLCLLVSASLLLGACQNMHGNTPTAFNGSNASRVDRAISSAARDAASVGQLRQSLAFYEKLYRKDPGNETFAIDYARALRKTGRVEDAKLVVGANARKDKASEPLLTEYAYVLIAAGEYDKALGIAQRAVTKSSKSARAHHALALALSGLGKHEDAEGQFRAALNLWPEDVDQTAVINNLAVSLAAQGKITQAQETMGMATGEALTNPTYQNNRVLLDGFQQSGIVREPVMAAKSGVVLKGRMKPIVE